MSVRINASAAYAVTRAVPDNSRSNAAATSTQEREAALKNQLEDRLNTDIARIRQRVDSGNTTTSTSEGKGRIVDIRA